MKNLLIIIVITFTTLLTSCNFTTPVNVFDNYPNIELIQNYGFSYTVKIPFGVSDETIMSFVNDLRGDNTRLVVGLYYVSAGTPYILKSNKMDNSLEYAATMITTNEYNKCYVYNDGAEYLDTYVNN